MPLKDPPGDAHGDIFQTQNIDNTAMILKENKMSNNSEDIA